MNFQQAKKDLDSYKQCITSPQQCQQNKELIHTNCFLPQHISFSFYATVSLTKAVERIKVVLALIFLSAIQMEKF